MRTLSLGIAAILFTTACSAMAESKWLESKRLDPSEIRALCERVSDVRMLELSTKFMKDCKVA